MGAVVEGSADLQVSTAAAEILSNSYVNFELYNDDACHISINGGSYIYIRANQGIAVDVITSLKIEENGITFNWVGTKR